MRAGETRWTGDEISEWRILRGCSLRVTARDTTEGRRYMATRDGRPVAVMEKRQDAKRAAERAAVAEAVRRERRIAGNGAGHG